MSQKKEESKENKPGVKIQDLTPSKDAKGGRAISQNAGASQDGTHGTNSTRNQDASSRSGKGLD